MSDPLFKSITAWVRFVVLLAGMASWCQGETLDFTRFLTVKTWRLRIVWAYQESSASGDETRHASVMGDVTYRLVKSDDTSPEIYQWRYDETYKPTGSLQLNSEHVIRMGPEWLKYVYQGGGIGEGEASFEMEPAVDKFTLGAIVRSADGAFETTSSKGTRDVSPMTVTLAATPPSQDWTGQIPASGLVLEGSRHDVPCFEPGATGGPMTVRFTLQPWEDEAPTEASFTMVDKDWLPDPDKPCAIEIKWKGKAKEVRVTLDNISQEPGTCLNSKAQGNEDDLLIESQGRWIVEHTGSGPNSKYVAVQVLPKDAPSPLKLNVKATDYGAWGKLRCEVLLNDKWTEAKEPSGKHMMELPDGSGEDHVARAWKKEHHVENQRGDADEDDDPKGDGRRGDGLTLYEEYRGFMVKGVHVSTDPKRKDLFISDQTANANYAGGDNNMAKDGIARFEALTGVVVHQVTQEELGENRVVNRRHNEGAHKVDQHGLILVRGPQDSFPEAISATTVHGPPILTEKVNLPSGRRWRRESPDSGTSSASARVEDNISTVAHELCHAVGVAHHGDGVRLVVWFWQKDAAGLPRLYEQAYGDLYLTQKSGAPIPIRAFFEADGRELTPGGALPGAADAKLGGSKQLIMGSHSEGSGEESCVMTYSGDAYMSDLAPDVRYIPDPAQRVPRTTLCNTKKGSSFNAPGHVPQPRYGDAAQGECRKQIVISDAYVNP